LTSDVKGATILGMDKEVAMQSSNNIDITANMNEIEKGIYASYLDWLNNYLTTVSFAEANNMDIDIATRIIDLGRSILVRHERALGNE